MSVLSRLPLEDEKNLSLEGSKVGEDKKEEIKIDPATERNEAEIHEEIENEIHEQGDDTAEGDKIVENDKEADAMMEVDCKDVKTEETVVNASDKTVEDETYAENEPLTGDDECEVTSPDVIPSSQTPSYESPFQSLRRMTIPLASILPTSLDSLRSKGNAAKKQQDKTQAETKSNGEEATAERHGENDVLERNEVDECDSPVKGDEAASPISKTKVSPVAGRTRRKLQQKTGGDKTPSRTKPDDEPIEQEVSELMQNYKYKVDTQTSTGKPAEPTLAGVPRDATSSPVPIVTNKFLRPFAAGGSPCRVTLRGRNSPGVSPTTGILKRWPGNKQSVDSPSPPGKVKFVSFFSCF